MKMETCSLWLVITFGLKIYRKSENARMIAQKVATVRDNKIILWISFFFGLPEITLLRIAMILLVTWLMNKLEHALVLPFVPDPVPFFFDPDELEPFAFKKPDTILIICRNVGEQLV